MPSNPLDDNRRHRRMLCEAQRRIRVPIQTRDVSAIERDLFLQRQARGMNRHADNLALDDQMRIDHVLDIQSVFVSHTDVEIRVINRVAHGALSPGRA